MTSTPITEVHVLDEPGLYEVTSSSPTVYYVDSRDPAAPTYMRWRGAGLSMTSPMDNVWHDLIRLTTVTDLAPEDVTEWTLTTGRFHTFYTTREADHPNGPLYWVSSRVCERIRRIDSPPLLDERERSDAWLPPAGRMVAITAVAVRHMGAWAVFVPEMSGLEVVVGALDDAGDAIAAKAAALTGRDQDDFIVSVQYVPPTVAEGERP